jgi:two-component system sensor histidine kinase ChvG
VRRSGGAQRLRLPASAGPFAFLRRLRDERGRLPISRLTITIFLTNFFGLSVLMGGSLRLSQYRDGLIDAKLEGVRAQAQVIASIMASIAAEDAECDILLEDGPGAPCQLFLNEERVNSIFTRVWPSFEGRVRVFSTPEAYDGGPVTRPHELLLQDRVLRGSSVEVGSLPDIDAPSTPSLVGAFLEDMRDSFVEIFIDNGFRAEASLNTLEDELTRAFNSSAGDPTPGASSLRYNEEGQVVASVSVPIRKVQAIYGVVTAEIGGIEQVLAKARGALFSFFFVALIVNIFLSFLLTMTIAGPIRKLAMAADRVRDGVRGTGRMRIPEFPRRHDEIGELSDSLKSMTQALYDRIETIDSFAADVAHELKNPMTSIRSAIETMDVAKTEESKTKLLNVIKNDVARMDRLITDISNASRLDADLARERREAVDVVKLVRDVVSSYQDDHRTNGVPVRIMVPRQLESAYVFGSASTLSRIFQNLIDNAISFSPRNGSVRVTVAKGRIHNGEATVISVADDGPGIPPESLDSIFKRFYTRRPEGTVFGNNSGLGLAICRQIAESHGGRIWAENRMDANDQERIGAVFHVVLPMRQGS